MKTIYLSLFLLLSSFHLIAQKSDVKIDEVRVHYDKTSLSSKQVGMDLSPSGKYLAFAFKDGIIRIFDTSSNRFIASSQFDYTDLFELRFSKKEERLILVTNEKWEIVNWKTKEILHSQLLPEKPSRVAVGNKQDWLAIGTYDVHVEVYDLSSYKKMFSTTLDKGNHIGGLDFSYDDKFLVMYGKPKTNTKGSQEVYEMISNKLIRSDNKAITKLGTNFSKEGDYIVHSYGYMFGIIDKWDFKSGESESVSLLGKGKKLKDLIMASNIYPIGNNYVVTGLYQGIGVYGRFGEVKFTTRRSSDTDAKSGRTFSWQMGIDVNNIKRIPNTSKFIINAYGDNINQIFDAENMEIIGYFYIDSNNEYAIIARDGRVDGVDQAFSKLAWTERKSNKRLPMDVNLEQFMTPRLYSILTSDESQIVDNSYLKDAIAQAPGITIISHDSITTSEQDNIEITYQTINNGDPVESVQILINGKSINSGTRGFKRIGDEHINVNLIPGQNIIKMYAISEQGYQSVADQIIVNYSGTPASSYLYLLSVGLDNYKNPKYNLNYANADATAFNASIADGSRTIFQGVKEYFIKDDEATRQNIESKFRDIASVIGPEDVFIFYYAGHGVMSEEEKPMFYVAPYDVTQMYGNNELLNSKAISADQLKAFSSTISAQKQLFVLDACQSGGMTEMLAMRGAAEEKAIAQLARSTGTYWLTASGSEQFATEFAELGHGLFTYTLLEGLGGKADGGNMDKKITVKELSAYLNDRVPELSEEHKGQAQYPTSYGYGQDFPIVIVK